MADFKLLVSTDSAGYLATPKEWSEVWDFVKNHPKFSGFEMLAWRSPWPNYLKRQFILAKVFGCPIVGIHGRIGWEKKYLNFEQWFWTAIYNETIESTKKLLENFTSEAEYLLLHRDEVTEETKKLIFRNKRHAGQILVENDHSRESVGIALQRAIEIDQLGVKAGVMIDIHHVFMSVPSNFGVMKRWEESLKILEEFLDEIQKFPQIEFGVHVPVATRASATIPLELPVESLREFGHLIKGKVKYVVIEAQPTNHDFLLSNSNIRRKLRDFNQTTIEKLDQAGII